MISVIMSVYREPEKICSEAVESVLGQTLADLELIIVADDPDNKALLRLVEGFAARDPRIVVLKNERNMGLASSMNWAIGAAKGEYVARMDADDVSLPERLALQKAYLEEHGLDLIGGGMTVIGPDGGTIRRIGRLPRTAAMVRRCLRTADCVPHGTWFGKRQTFLDLRGYRDTPFSEDYDFLARAALTGHRISNLPLTVYKYRRPGNEDRSGKLWKQYLSLRFISREYRHGRTADKEALERYVGRRAGGGGARRFTLADRAFYGALGALEQGKYGPAAGAFAHLLGSCSLSYLDRILRFLWLSICARISMNHPET